MANEIKLNGITSGLSNLWAVIEDNTGKLYRSDTHVFETFNASNWGLYNSVQLTEQGTSGRYRASMPTAITLGGKYNLEIRKWAGGSASQSDTVISSTDIEWNQTLTEFSTAADLYVLRNTVHGRYTFNEGTLVKQDQLDDGTTNTGSPITLTVSASGNVTKL